uniref:Integrase catalytic domain-containing protein n=1 Tax=Tanacetum cinerariifolium TaxID=118510 RepID=A0A6L2KJE2_TANCI|nr:hypothetical protein [Tanacetum cinerariifolium]
MSTQQDIYATGFENRPPMLNKENYVSWSSCLLQYAKSRPNGKLIHNSIINGPYVRRMIPEPGDPNRETILLGLPEDIYAAVDSCETAQEVWLRVQQMMKGFDIGIQEKKAKLFNECERFTSNDRESIESYYHRLIMLMNDLKRNKHFPEKIASNLKFLNNLQPEWSRHVTIVHQTKDLHTADYTQLDDFMNYNQKEDQPSFNQNYMQQPMPNPEDITDPITAMNMALALMAKAFKLNYSTPTNNNQRISSNLRNANQNPNGNGNLVVARAEGNATGHNGNQIRCYNCRGKEEARIQLQAEEFDLMAAAADLDEIEEVNANYILMANLQQASTSGTQTNKAPVYDSDGSVENDNNVISEDSSVEQSGGKIEHHPTNVKETRALYDSLYNNLAIEVEKVNTVNHKLSETNAELTTELEQCLSKKINALHLSFGKQIMTLNGEISDLNKQLSMEKSIVSSLLEEKKKLKSDFKIREDELLDKKIQLEKKIKELDNIWLKWKMALGYKNRFYLKQAQQKQQSLYDGKVLLEKPDPPVVHDSEETLQLAQESRLKMKQLNKEIKPANYTKTNHLSGVFVSQMAKSRKELYFSNTSKTANVSKPMSIPNEEFSDDTTPSVARKFLNEVKSTIVTLQHVIKQRMTLETHNWSSSAHQKLHKIVKDEIFPIVNHVDARVQNFEIQFLKEAVKFVGDFKSLAKEADESLANHKALELEIECLLRAVVSHDVLSIVQNNSVDETSNLQTELERTKEQFENCIIRKENEYTKLWNDWYKKCEECKFDKISYDKAYNDMQQKIKRLQAQLGDLKGISKDTSCVSDQKDTACGKSANTKFAKKSILGKPPTVGETHSLSKPIRKVASIERLASPKPSKPRSFLRWSPTGRLFDLKGKIIASSESESQSDCSKGCSKHMTGKIKLLINFVWKFFGTVRFRTDHVAAILGQFCDSDLDITFRRNACFIRNLEGVDLLKGDRTTNLYTINLYEIASASSICLMARATSTKNIFILHVSKEHLVTGLPKFKYHKEHLCPSREQGKSKRASYPPKPVPNFRQRLHLLHMDLCGPMRIASINGNRYVLVIVNDYSRYTWVQFLISKDEAPEVIKTFLKRITILLQSPIIIIRTDNGSEFNQVLKEYFDSLGISHQVSSIRTPQQNGVVERRNRTLVKGARTMLILSRAPLFLWVEAIATAHIGKLGAKGDIGFFIGYSADSCAFRVMTSGQTSLGLDLTYAPSTIRTQQPTEGELNLLFEAMYDDYIGGQPSSAPQIVPDAQEHPVRQTPMTSTSIADTAPTPTNSSSQDTNFTNTSPDVDELNS